ncbi:TonB-dependent receptor [Massilia atriviolacea]|uniref:TonB-dependent receptor n=1 Tax=Massilia atriviolacea TaxID=2495579 RepID=A0A430HML2_9BURK|nr:TonB-dependent receptor [Massilia atriviolacea]RSZ58741.1 TonB-dependent receptor [Massilia atriviolacea]
MKKPFVLKQSVIAVALTIGVSHVAMAQQQSAQPIQKVVVTGSNIKRAVDEETSSPVQVIGRLEIAAIGASTVKDVLDTLTSKSSDLTDIDGGNSFASGATGISLRNLGKGSTLTLLNGRRVANYGLADGGQETFVNIDAMPSEIIDRIEILLDGASAVYGSDAVAGVVNIITRKDFSGVMVNAGLRQSLLKSAINKDKTASLTGGYGDIEKDGYNVFGHFEAYHRSPYDDRTIMPAAPAWYKEYVNPSFGVKSTYSYPGNFVDRYPANYSDPALAGKSFNTPVAGCKDIEEGTCRFDQWARVGIHPEAKRYNFFGSGRLKLGGNRTAFSEVTLGQTTTTYFNAPPIMQYTGTPSTWFNSKEGKLNSFLEPKLPVGHPNNPYSFPVALRYRYADNVNLFKSDAEAKQYRVMVGLEGSDYGWDWNTAVGAMGSKVENTIRGGKHAANYLAAINSGEYKFGGVNSPELLNKMFPNLLFGGESKQVFIDFKATRELMQLSGGPLSLAVGGDFRTDSFDAYVSDNISNAEIVSYGSINVTGKRHISAAFAELNAPITKSLELNAAMRVDKVGDTDISVVPKVGMRYEVSKRFIVRGTVANGFRAPNVAETGKVDLSAFQNSNVDPKRCATANQLYNILKDGNTIDKADALTARDRGCSVSFASQVKGNPELEPEKSRSYNVGFVLQPLDSLSLTMDYYRIERRNQIGTKTVTQILADEDRLPGSVQRRAVTEEDKRLSARAKELSGKDIQFPIGPVASISNRYENMDRARVSGIDMEINHRWNLGSAGRLVSNLKGNYQLDYRKWDTVTDTFTENLSGNYENYEYQVRASTTWSQGPFKLGGAVTYRPETSLMEDRYDENYNAAGCEDQGIPSEFCRVKKDVVTDLHMSYTGIKNTTIALNLYNVFDRAAPPDVRLANPPLRGRSARVSLQYVF